MFLTYERDLAKVKGQAEGHSSFLLAVLIVRNTNICIQQYVNQSR